MTNLQRLYKKIDVQKVAIENNNFQEATDLEDEIDFLISELTQEELKNFLNL